MRRYAGDPRRVLARRAGVAAVGLALVVATVVLVLGPVVALVGGAASLGPVLPVPVVSSTVAVVMLLALALALVALAAASRSRPLAWALVIAAWAVSLAASLWPIVATALVAVDRVGDVVPWIVDLVGRVR